MTDMLRAMTRVCAVFVFGTPPPFFFLGLGASCNLLARLILIPDRGWIGEIIAIPPMLIYQSPLHN